MGWADGHVVRAGRQDGCPHRQRRRRRRRKHTGTTQEQEGQEKQRQSGNASISAQIRVDSAGVASCQCKYSFWCEASQMCAGVRGACRRCSKAGTRAEGWMVWKAAGRAHTRQWQAEACLSIGCHQRWLPAFRSNFCKTSQTCEGCATRQAGRGRQQHLSTDSCRQRWRGQLSGQIFIFGVKHHRCLRSCTFKQGGGLAVKQEGRCDERQR